MTSNNGETRYQVRLTEDYRRMLRELAVELSTPAAQATEASALRLAIREAAERRGIEVAA